MRILNVIQSIVLRQLSNLHSMPQIKKPLIGFLKLDIPQKK